MLYGNISYCRDIHLFFFSVTDESPITSSFQTASTACLIQLIWHHCSFSQNKEGAVAGINGHVNMII